MRHITFIDVPHTYRNANGVTVKAGRYRLGDTELQGLGAYFIELGYETYTETIEDEPKPTLPKSGKDKP